MTSFARSTTLYARLSRRQARAVLSLIAVAAVAGAMVTLSPLGSTNLNPHEGLAGDVELYRAEVDRIHNGQGYYQAAAAELTARGYPTRSVFNWRTPLPMWLLGKMPVVVLGKALLGALALTLTLLAFAAMSNDNERRLTENSRRRTAGGNTVANATKMSLALPIGCALLLTGPLLPTILGDLFVMPVLWAGVLIALSACAYGVDRPGWGVAFGLAAIFCRELALPYGALCAAIAWRQRRRGELSAWLAGLLAWLAFFGWHWWLVSDLAAVGTRAHPHGWIQFGAAGFVISTAQMNAYLLLLPQWVTAIYLVAALVGFAGWSTPLGTRIGVTTCLFLMAFAVVGQSFNQYWGSLIAPLLCFGVARMPASMRDLWDAAEERD